MSTHNITDLETFARNFRTDKIGLGYLPIYLEHFEKCNIKRDSYIEILEIGTNKGSSLRMWAEYFPNSRVYGLDITDKYEEANLLDHNRIKWAIADQGDRESLREILSTKFGKMAPWFDIAVPISQRQFDIIIDDGSHDQTHQQVSWGFLFHWLRSNGLYIIEDLVTGNPGWNANMYNIGRIKPTREVLMEFQNNGTLKSSVMDQTLEIENIIRTYEYCEHRIVTGTKNGFNPEIAFIKRKHG